MNKKSLLILCITIIYSISGFAQSQRDTLVFATYNLRIETDADTGVRNWENRKSQIANLIHKYRFDVFVAQEIANNKQLKDLKKLLPEYKNISYGRDNQKGTEGERLAIFYKKDKFSLRDRSFFFLSETPDKVSKGWDAMYNRICMYAKLSKKGSAKDFYVFNTHFDHIGELARWESAKLISAKITDLTSDNVPVFLMGDFNSPPSDTLFYTVLSSQFYDSQKAVNNTAETGLSPGTFNDWMGNETYFDETQRIDFIFVKNVNVILYEVLHDKFIDEIYPSDHFPVKVKIVL